MLDILVQSACLRSAAFAYHATGFGKAKFQDVKGDYVGTNKIAAAHRAMFALHLDGANAADLAQVLARPHLRGIIIAPQARTDLVARPVNYADQLLENAISPRVFALFRSTIERQRPGQPIEKSLLVDAAFRLKSLIHRGFDEAVDSFHTGQRTRGWQEFRPGIDPPPLAGVSGQEKAFGGDMEVQVAGPTHYGDLTEIILGLSQEITDKANPAIAHPSVLEIRIAEVESTTK
jgi:hypothetical protein